VLAQIGSPFAPANGPVPGDHALNPAA